MSYQYAEQFRLAIANSGLTPPDNLVADGVLHRFSKDGERFDDSGWFVFFADGLGGVFGCWSWGMTENWRADTGREWTNAELDAHRRQTEEAKRKRDAEKVRMQLEAKEQAASIWATSTPAEDTNPYLLRKGIKPHGVREKPSYSGEPTLRIPMFADGELWNIQTVYETGLKMFTKGGRVSGCYYLIGESQSAEVVCIAEGFATGATVYEATGFPTYVAFTASNLLHVAKAVRSMHPDARIIIAGDDDWQTEGNTGKTKAIEAADAVFGKAAFPVFGSDREGDDTDFNDMHARYGLNSVRELIVGEIAALKAQEAPYDDETDTADVDAPEVGRDSPAEDSGGWLVPQPLIAKIDSEPYPLDALPPTIHAAVVEVQAFTKAPIAMVAGCALSTLSLACQGHADVERDKGLQGTTSLYVLTIADSGERKSTVDSFFTQPIREYQDAQRERMKPELDKHAAELLAWKSEVEGVSAAIREASKKGEPIDDLKTNLVDVQADQPVRPAVPRLVLGDETPENLAWTLAKEWASAGVLSSEAGLVLGSRSMSKDSVMRNLGLLNILWDGGSLNIGRKTSDTFTVESVRLTMGLQVQGETIRGFIGNTGELARGTGFFARFLVANPTSTQGTRFYTDPPSDYPSLTVFQKRISQILEMPLQFDSQGKLAPQLMRFTAGAKKVWVTFHDAIEAQLGSGGELFDVRDVASKAADNVARIAALFQMFEHGVGAVDADMVSRASRLVAWHLNESRRFFGEIALPQELSDAVRLDSWLMDEAKRTGSCTVSKRYTRQYGGVRDGGRLNNAVKELESLDRLREIKDGKKVLLQLNPLLLSADRAAG